MTLSEQLALVKRREQAEAWDRGEQKIATQYGSRLPQPPDLSDEDRTALKPFIEWAADNSARFCPCKPHVLAAYILTQASTGLDEQELLKEVEAVDRLHQRNGLASPVATTACRAALEQVLHYVEPPRSWLKSEKESFVTMPIEVKAAVVRRERDRETQLRRMQNELAELKKRQKQTAPESSKPVEPKEKETTNMASKKTQKGLGAYTDDKDPIVRRENRNSWDRKDISKQVDPSWERRDGFAAKLDKGKE